jgi:serine/threonine protein kinase/formylglycine-generating enzyme required for sulfatase activity
VEDAARVADRFDLEKKLGAGAFGEAHVALDSQTGQKVVLKLIHPQYANNLELVERFRREIRALELVKHPCVPQLIAHGTDGADGRVYYAMEFCAGRDLYEAMEEETGPWPLKRSCLIIDDVFSALGAAHDVGVIHRDLKPANLVLVPAAGGLERVKLIDFGIAKHLQGGERTTLDITGGRAVGTPFYLSPEGAGGDVVDQRSDLYTAGAILYELLTDRRPVNGTTVRAILTSILRDPPPKIRKIRPELPEALEELILKLMAKDPDERPATAREAKVLLRQACPDVFRDVSSSAVTAIPGHAAPKRLSEGEDPYLARTIAGKYDLRQLLGQGGFGRVYRAWHTELDMAVALKVISFGAEASPELLQEIHERFKREARAMRSFTHKHAVQVRDFGRDGDVFYLELDYVEGRTLEEALKQEGTLSEERTLRMAGQVLSALAEAHQVGIVHRDLKPANIMITGEGEQESAIILDFGIVKLVGAMEDNTAPGLTGAGVAIGTVQYMSPEQAGGDPVTYASDVYSLATVLYKCLAGRLPISTGEARTQSSLRARIMTRSPDPLSETAPGLSQQTQTTIMGALAKEEASRPPDATRFAEQLLTGTPHLLLPGGTSLLTQPLRPEPTETSPGVPAAVLVLLVILLAGGAALLVPEIRERVLAAVSGKTGSTKTDSAKTGSAKTGSTKTDSTKTDSAKTDSTKTDSTKTDSAKTDSAKTDSAKTGSTKTGSTKTGSTKTGSTKTDEPPRVARLSLEVNAPAEGAEVTSLPFLVTGSSSGPPGRVVELRVGGALVAQSVLSTKDDEFSLQVAKIAEGEVKLVIRVTAPQVAAGREVTRVVNVSTQGVVPGWWAKVEESRRPPLPLPSGVTFARESAVYVNEKDGSELVFVPGGEFAMGEKGRQTSVDPYFLGRYEVSAAQAAKILGRPAPKPSLADLPATGLCWDDAAIYCQKAGLRLPKEAEWEFAARGSNNHEWPWGASSPTKERVNIEGESLRPVGEYEAGESPFGCRNMVGNASEWVFDRLRAGSNRRVVKGGSHRSQLAKPGYYRPSHRMGFKHERTDRAELGFRVARSLSKAR